MKPDPRHKIQISGNNVSGWIQAEFKLATGNELKPHRLKSSEYNLPSTFTGPNYSQMYPLEEIRQSAFF